MMQHEAGRLVRITLFINGIDFGFCLNAFFITHVVKELPSLFLSILPDHTSYHRSVTWTGSSKITALCADTSQPA